MRRWVRVLVVAGAFLCVGLGFPPLAGAYVYWTNYGGGSIGRAKLDGTAVDQSFIVAASPWGVAVDGSHIYWSEPGAHAIGRANLDGTDVNEGFISTGPCSPLGLAVDGSYIYWAQHYSAYCWTLGRASLDGSGVDPYFGLIPGYTQNSGTWSVAVTDTSLYVVGDQAYPFGGGRTISSVSLDGRENSPLATVEDPYGLAVGSTYLYWTDGGGGSIWRDPLNGSSASEALITGASAPRGMAIDPAHLYWANSTSGSIGRAAADGSDVNQDFITGASSPMAAAVDAAELSPTATVVDCTPVSLPLADVTTCTTTVADTGSGPPSAPTGTVRYSATSSSGVTDLGRCLLSSISASEAACELTYTPGLQGSVQITATYEGDSHHAPTYDQASLSVVPRSTSTSVTCSPDAVPIGGTTSCTTNITDTAPGTPSPPQGMVSASVLSSGGSVAGIGYCYPAPFAGGQAQCQFSYTPTAGEAGTQTIIASFIDGGTHGASSSQAMVIVSVRPTAVSVGCLPASTIPGRPIICTATVIDATASGESPPTGTVAFATDGLGTFSGTCALAPVSTSAAGCSASYLPNLTAAGRSRLDTITGSYNGSQTHAASAATTVVVLLAAPLATTRAPSSITASGATLDGTVNPNGEAATYRFEYGTTTAYGSRAPSVDTIAGSDYADHSVSQAVSGLAEGTTYHFRVVATNATGTSYGADQTFTTQVLPRAAAVPGKVRALGTKLKFIFACSLAGGQPCHGQAAATAIEKLSASGRITGVLASKPHTVHYRVVTIAKGNLSALAGQSKNFSIGLNSTGQMLRNRFKNVPSDVTIRVVTRGRWAIIRMAKVTFKR